MASASQFPPDREVPLLQRGNIQEQGGRSDAFPAPIEPGGKPVHFTEEQLVQRAVELHPHKVTGHAAGKAVLYTLLASTILAGLIGAMAGLDAGGAKHFVDGFLLGAAFGGVGGFIISGIVLSSPPVREELIKNSALTIMASIHGLHPTAIPEDLATDF